MAVIGVIRHILRNERNLISINIKYRQLVFTALGLLCGGVFYLTSEFAAGGLILALAFILYCPAVVMHELLHARAFAELGAFEGEVVVFKAESDSRQFSAGAASYCYNRLEPCYAPRRYIRILLSPLLFQLPVFVFLSSAVIWGSRVPERWIIVLVCTVLFLNPSLQDLLSSLKCLRLGGPVREVITGGEFRIESCGD